MLSWIKYKKDKGEELVKINILHSYIRIEKIEIIVISFFPETTSTLFIFFPSIFSLIRTLT